MIGKTIFSTGAALGALVFTLGLAAGSAAAHNHTTTGALVAGSTAQVRHNVSYDWHNPNGTRTATRATVRTQRVQTRLIGRASWVCSPAGFGRPSTCSAR